MTDPRTKLFVALSLSIGALGPSSPWFLICAGGGLTAWTIHSRLPLSALFGRLWTAVWFLIAIALINALTVDGHVVVEFGTLYVTREGLVQGAEQSLRLVLVLWGALLFIRTTPLADILDVAEQWTARKGHPLVGVGMVAVNYLPLLVASARRVRNARRARGFDDRSGVVSGIRAAAAATLPLFATALRNADMLADAMESRCFLPTAPRTPFRSLIMPRGEALLLCIVLILVIIALLVPR
ncbi:MAG: energy-coupling factor transporter transmembrane component T [Bacteroidota bacterium]